MPAPSQSDAEVRRPPLVFQDAPPSRGRRSPARWTSSLAHSARTRRRVRTARAARCLAGSLRRHSSVSPRLRLVRKCSPMSSLPAILARGEGQVKLDVDRGPAAIVTRLWGQLRIRWGSGELGRVTGCRPRGLTIRRRGRRGNAIIPACEGGAQPAGLNLLYPVQCASREPQCRLRQLPGRKGDGSDVGGGRPLRQTCTTSARQGTSPWSR